MAAAIFRQNSACSTSYLVKPDLAENSTGVQIRLQSSFVKRNLARVFKQPNKWSCAKQAQRHSNLKSRSAARAEAGFASASSAGNENPIHIVRRGDTLYAIARKYKVRMTDLAELNNIHLQRKVPLLIGDAVTLPKGATLKPRKGITAIITSHSALPASHLPLLQRLKIWSPAAHPSKRKTKVAGQETGTSPQAAVRAKSSTPREYIVEPGDTPESVARKMGLTLEEFWAVAKVERSPRNTHCLPCQQAQDRLLEEQQATNVQSNEPSDANKQELHSSVGQSPILPQSDTWGQWTTANMMFIGAALAAPVLLTAGLLWSGRWPAPPEAKRNFPEAATFTKGELSGAPVLSEATTPASTGLNGRAGEGQEDAGGLQNDVRSAGSDGIGANGWHMYRTDSGRLTTPSGENGGVNDSDKNGNGTVEGSPAATEGIERT